MFRVGGSRRLQSTVKVEGVSVSECQTGLSLSLSAVEDEDDLRDLFP